MVAARGDGKGQGRPARWRLQGCRWLACLLLLCLCLGASARPGRDYTVDRWTTREGLPHNSLRDIAQTPDGQLWLATWEGLVRHTGQGFTTIDRGSRPGLLDNGLGALHVDARGNLWLGDSRGNVMRRDPQGNWTAHPAEPPSPGVLVQAIRSDGEGGVWLLYEGKGLGRLDAEGRFHFVPPPDGVTLALSYPRMEVDAQGRVWIGSQHGLVVREPDGRLHNPSRELGLAADLAWPYLDRKGTLWVVNGNAVYRMEQGRPRLYHRFTGMPVVTEMLVDSTGRLWAGSESDGLAWRDPDGSEGRLAEMHQPRGRILSLHQDAEGSVWVGANGGLYRVRETLFGSLTSTDGLRNDYVRAVLEDPQGRLWIGGPLGLECIGADGRIRHQPLPRLKGGGGPVSVLSLAMDSRGALWVGSYADGVFRLDPDGSVHHYGEPQALSGGNVRALADDGEGGMWIGTQGGLLHMSGGQIHPAGLPGLPRELITALIVHEGELWIGSTEGLRRVHRGRIERMPVLEEGGGRTTFGFTPVGRSLWISTDRGLYRFRDGLLAHVGIEEGLPVDTVFKLVPDDRGNAWIAANRGVLRMEMAALEAVADGRRVVLEVDRHSEPDGMSSAQVNGSSGPVALRRTDGTIWFATAGGVSWVDPQRLERLRGQQVQGARIESVRVDDAETSWLVTGLSVPAGGRLAVTYTGMSYLFSERTRFRTRLVGLEPDWVERGGQRELVYIGLRPGHYTLQVQARHPGGRWDGPVAQLSFNVTPPWWQHPLVSLLAVLGLLVLGVLVYRFAVWRYRERLSELQGRLVESSRELQLQAERLLAANQEHARLQKQLEEQAEAFDRQAHEDSMTGLANRRAFTEALSREFARHQRGDHALCLLLLDLDHFKSINERYSRAVGDQVLAEVGRLLGSACRESDLAARLGGEEFAVLLVDTGLRDAELACTRLKSLFADRAAWAGIPGLKVGFSAGLVEAGPHDVTAQSVFERAAEALSRSQQNGGDLISVG